MQKNNLQGFFHTGLLILSVGLFTLVAGSSYKLASSSNVRVNNVKNAFSQLLAFEKSPTTNVLEYATSQWIFEETFDGDPTSPSQNLLPKSLDYVATHRSVPSETNGTLPDNTYGTFLADHGTDCTGPNMQHTTTTDHKSNGNNPDKSFFICKDHMMSSMGDVSGYSIASFWPKMEFDFTNGGQISFDVNLNDGHPRSWWEIVITPRDQMKFGAAQEFWPVDETYSKDRIVLTFDPESKRSIEVGKGSIAPNGWIVQSKDWRTWRNIVPNDPALTDRKIRRNMIIDIQNDQLVWKVQKEDGSYDSYATSIPGGLPFNKGVVMFKTHAYTPEKDGNNNLYTYHWDNLKVAGGVSQKWETYEISDVAVLSANGSVSIGTSTTQTLNLPSVGNSPVFVGQVMGGFVGQVLLSVNDGPTISVVPLDKTCNIEGWSTFRIPLNASALKQGVNTFKWTVGPRPSCAPSWMWDGFSVKGSEIEFDVDGGILPPPPPPAPLDTVPPVLTNLLPTGTLSVDTKTAVLGVTTNEAAVCKYSQNADMSFDSMPNTLVSDNATVHTSTVAELVNGTLYNYYVRCQDTSPQKNTNTSGAHISFSVAQTPVPGATTFNADYFDGVTLSNKKKSDTVSSIDFNWGKGSPYRTLLGKDTYSIRYTATVFFAAGTYNFVATSDDGVRLFIDDNLIIDDWKIHAVKTNTAGYTLSEGFHKVVLEYFENGGDASVSLKW